MDQRTIYVHADWAGINGPRMIGELRVDRSRGKETYAFLYVPEWLGHKARASFDPDLQYFAGPQYPSAGRAGFGFILDSSPDRWGQMLLKRREAQRARNEARTVRPLSATDMLLAVSDITRMGALRFSLEPHGPWLNADPANGIPPMTRLRKVEQAAWMAENDDASIEEHLEALALLLAPGSSLGGARPKANVVDPQGRLWIAKFPSRGDAEDKGAWEMVVHGLASRSGIRMAPAELRQFGKNGHTFLTQRFDRDHRSDRVHFASAMTMLRRRDGDDAQIGASYLELVEFIMTHGARPGPDLVQLWDRIAFNICVSNTDDHLRNHGFLLAEDGWRLSPAYDLNPEPEGHGLSLNIDEHDNALSMSVAIDAAPYFRIEKDKAAARAQDMAERVEKNWRELATACGIGRNAIERMQPAFDRKP